MIVSFCFVILQMKICTSELVKPIIFSLSSTFIWFANEKVYIGTFSLNSVPFGVFDWVCSKGTSKMINIEIKKSLFKIIQYLFFFFWYISQQLFWDVGWFCSHSRFILGTEMVLSSSDLPSVRSLLAGDSLTAKFIWISSFQYHFNFSHS